MIVVDTLAEGRRLSVGGTGLVPTMGYLHEGHLSLIGEARRRSDTVVVSLFVNPLQFHDQTDLERYPRRPDRDAELAEAAGTDVLVAPSVAEMYPTAPLTTVAVAEVGDVLEGAHRPGHFAGVATVVAKLLAGLGPDLAFFGRKDHQQLAVIRRMVSDLSFPVEVVGCPTIRSPDGLALSSRNVLLDPGGRRRAHTVSAGLFAAAAAVEEGERDGATLETTAARHLEVDAVDYVSLVDQAHCRPLARLDRPAFLATAVHIGPVRLIDNLPFDVLAGEVVPDRGVRLSGPSLLDERP